MTHPVVQTPGKRWTASELRKLPPDQRDAILTAAAEQAEEDYRNDADLTAFEAFGTSRLLVKNTATRPILPHEERRA